MKKLKLLLFGVVILESCISAAQSKYDIPEGKYDLYLNIFLSHCKKVASNLPYNIKINNDLFDIENPREYIALSLPFILDGDTTLYYYMTKPQYDYFMDADSLVLRSPSYRTLFSFNAVGCFDYKDYMVVVYSFPLDDPNYYKCYTVNTYTKDGKRIDRLPFFMWRRDIDAEEFGDELDPSWLEMTGYIDENFEITICQRTKWSVIHSRDGKDFSKEYFKEQDEMRSHREYHVYRIDETGHFEEVKKVNLYEVDDNNTWSKKSDR